MIKKITKVISKGFGTPDGQAAMHKYYDMTKHDGWKVHQGIIIDVANRLSQYMLSEEYTNLDKDEKDAQQRGIYIGKEIIDFLFDPMKGLRINNAIKRHNKKMEATLRGSDRKEK